MSDEHTIPGGRAQLFRTIFEQSIVGIALADLDGRLLETNDAFQRMLGYSAAELIGKPLAEITHPDDWQVEAPLLAASRDPSGRDAQVRLVKRYMRKDGTLVWARLHACTIRDAQGRPIFGLGMVEDITEQKQAEDRLADEKERLSVTLRSIGDAVIATDTDGRIRVFNKVAETLTAWPMEAALIRRIDEVIFLQERETHQPCVEPFKEVLGGRARLDLSGPLMLMTRDGREHMVVGTANAIFDRASRPIGMVLAFRDVTERIQVEEEQLRRDKLDSLGFLAGGIAHDFNNLLTTILGNVTLARSEKHEGNIHELLGAAEQATLQAKDLTLQLLTFAEGGVPIKQVVSPADVIRESAHLALRGSASRVEFHIPAGLHTVDMDPGQIGQVIRNLTINADQAMPGGGRVVIEAENMTLEDAASGSIPPGRYVRIAITDSGIGIPERYLDKIFDPYFTTKAQGSGLGLATSLSIVRHHGGHIRVQSRVGIGSMFEVILPAATAAAVPAPILEPAGGAARPGRVLVMDDEETIRQISSRILTRHGFTVVTAPDGAAALHLYEEALRNGAPFDVVILDLTIRGGMGGRDTMRALQELDPRVKAIVSSGYSNDPVMSTYRQHGFRGVVAKPYQMDSFVETVRRIAAEAN